MSWILLAILSALFLGLYDVSKKAAVDANAVLPVLFGSSVAGSAVVLVVLLLGLLFPHPMRSAELVLVPLSSLQHLLVLLKAVIVTSSWVLNFFAIKHLPISIASPIRASAPVFTLLGAVMLFGESPSSTQWLGISVILSAYLAFSLIGRAEGIRFTNNRWVALLVAGTLLGALSGLYDKHLLQNALIPPSTLQCWFTLYNAALQGALVLFLWCPGRRTTTPFSWRRSIVLVGILLIVADHLYFRALSEPTALVSVVSMIRRSNVVISFSVGALLFREQLLYRKAGALAVVLLGVWLLLGT